MTFRRSYLNSRRRRSSECTDGAIRAEKEAAKDLA